MEKIRGLKIYSEEIRGLKILDPSEENTPGGSVPLKISTPKGSTLAGHPLHVWSSPGTGKKRRGVD